MWGYMLIWAHICARGYCTQSQSLMCCCFPCTIYFCVVMGSLIDWVAREFQGCLSPPFCSPALGSQLQTTRPSCFYEGLKIRFRSSSLQTSPLPSEFSLEPQIIPFFFFSQFSLNVINHLANATTAHNLGSAALMFLCRWFLGRKTMKHRNRLGYTLPSPKIS